MPLPIITDCNDCGACCMHMGTPPLYVVFFVEEPPPWWIEMFHEAEPYFAGMPVEARRELAAYYAARKRGEVEDRAGAPCLWLDAATRKCRGHAWRPTVYHLRMRRFSTEWK